MKGLMRIGLRGWVAIDYGEWCAVIGDGCQRGKARGSDCLKKRRRLQNKRRHAGGT